MQTGQQLDREAILQLERRAISDLIIQTDATGLGRGLERLRTPGKYVIATNARMEAVCLCWNGRDDSVVTAEILAEIFAEVKDLGLRKPVRVYGARSPVGETNSYQFCQIPDEILARLQITEAEETGSLQEVDCEAPT